MHRVPWTAGLFVALALSLACDRPAAPAAPTPAPPEAGPVEACTRCGASVLPGLPATPDGDGDARQADAARADAGQDDSGVPDAGNDDAGCSETWTRYPAAFTHSPITCAVTENLRRIEALEPSRDPHVFMKVGDSISGGHEFMTCFETSPPTFTDGYGELEQAHSWFAAGDVEGSTPYARSSLSALASRTAEWALREEPPPVEQELSASDARFALVMFGTNDIGYGGPSSSAAFKFPWMYESLLELVDWLAVRGVVPIMYTIPPYHGEHPELGQLVSTWNVVLRAMAEGRQLPIVDYYSEMLQLPDCGLRSDGVHPSADYLNLCDFSEETGLIWGYNLRNLLSMQALDRVWQVTGEEPLREGWDAAGATHLAGSGSAGAARVIDRLPFAEMVDLGASAQASLADYDGCDVTLSGAERVYRVELPAPTPMRVMALHASSIDVDVLWLSTASAGSCHAADDVMLRGTFPAGTHHFVVDAPSVDDEGEVLFLVAPCHPEDQRCLGELSY